jgi:hypothetical protein
VQAFCNLQERSATSSIVKWAASQLDCEFCWSTCVLMFTSTSISLGFSLFLLQSNYSCLHIQRMKKCQNTHAPANQTLHNTKNPREFTCRLLALSLPSTRDHILSPPPSPHSTQQCPFPLWVRQHLRGSGMPMQLFSASLALPPGAFASLRLQVCSGLFHTCDG